ncbi:MAG: histidine kinase [Proteobacteria bacterium]|nr:histidine kinase [Pseudomonadota bacterium]
MHRIEVVSSEDEAPVPVLPDCANPGVALRVLLLIQAMLLCVAWSASDGLDDLLNAWTSEQIAVLPAMLIGLPLLSLIRKRAWLWPEWLQWTGLLLVSASLSMLSAWLALYFSTSETISIREQWFSLFGRGLGAAGSAAMIAQVLRWREQALSPALDRARLQALQSKIRPHFLFNALNAVLGLLRSEPRRAEVVLEGLADLFRMLLRDERELVPLADEVRFCRDYLAVESERLGDRLQVDFDLEPSALGALVPPLLLQPLLENAVHHGIEPATEGGKVLLRVYRRADRVRVMIENPMTSDGPLRAGRQMALSNVRQRLALLYDIEASMHIERSKAYFRLTLEFPCREEKKTAHV